jgi:ABC-type thiamine transport system substrate-binding protein
MKGLKEAGRDPQGKEIITKVRCAVNEDREKAKVTLKRQMVYHMLADYYADAFSEMGFRDEVAGVKSTFLKSGYNEAVKYLISNERSDEMLSRLALIPATSVSELKTELRKYADVKATRISVDYKPSTDHPVEEVLQFLREW